MHTRIHAPYYNLDAWWVDSCMWDEMECNATDFEASLTDYGMCYTFNKDDGKTKLRTVERTGKTLH